MKTYYVTHKDKHGERHQLGGSIEADTPEEALRLILEASGGVDDGNFEVFEEEQNK